MDDLKVLANAAAPLLDRNGGYATYRGKEPDGGPAYVQYHDGTKPKLRLNGRGGTKKQKSRSNNRKSYKRKTRRSRK
jgi:hypothetical protein